MKKTTLITLLSAAIFSSSAAMADTTNGTFISYSSEKDAAAVAKYAVEKNLHGYILWAVDGDTNPDTQSTSLLRALSDNKSAGQKVMAYWTDWSIYNSSHKLPARDYPIPGSFANDGKTTVNNPDLTAQLKYIDTLTYSFIEVQTKGPTMGAIYFVDPWADLTGKESICSGAFSSMCSYVGTGYGRGNFDAFTALNIPGKVFSIGGYGHDDAFEVLFNNPTATQNFIDSIKALFKAYPSLTGVDLDYENVSMTPKQSEGYLAVVKALSESLANDPDPNMKSKKITLAILADDQHLSVAPTASIGFEDGVLNEIASFDNVERINLMTYDFHGAFDYNTQGTGRTGFLSNLYMPENSPSGYDPKYSIAKSVDALIAAKVNTDKIGVGVPAYGRSISNVDKGASNGLFSIITDQATTIGGDLDNPSCVEAKISAGSPTACTGQFSYYYIVNNLLKSGFIASDATSSGVNIGSYAFGEIAPTPTFSMQVSNTGDTTDAAFTFTVADAQGDIFSNTQGWINPSANFVYTLDNSPSLSTVEGKKALTVTVTNWKGSLPCKDVNGNLMPFDFNSNVNIMIKTQGDNIVCAVGRPSSK